MLACLRDQLETWNLEPETFLAGIAKRLKAAVCKTVNHRFKSDNPLQLRELSAQCSGKTLNAERLPSGPRSFNVELSLTGKAPHCERGRCGFKSRRSTHIDPGPWQKGVCTSLSTKTMTVRVRSVPPPQFWILDFGFRSRPKSKIT